MANKHFFISGNVTTEKYKTKAGGGSDKPLQIRDRASHSATLLQKFDAIKAERDSLNEKREAEQIPTREGTYLLFSSQANHELINKSLESHLKQVENKTRYSLIVSLETPVQDIALYTTVKNMVEIPIEIQTS